MIGPLLATRSEWSAPGTVSTRTCGSTEADRDAGIAFVDAALDELLAIPSRRPRDLLFKLSALACEYGNDWHLQHIKALVPMRRRFAA